MWILQQTIFRVNWSCIPRKNTHRRKAIALYNNMKKKNKPISCFKNTQKYVQWSQTFPTQAMPRQICSFRDSKVSRQTTHRGEAIFLHNMQRPIFFKWPPQNKLPDKTNSSKVKSPFLEIACIDNKFYMIHISPQDVGLFSRKPPCSLSSLLTPSRAW